MIGSFCVLNKMPDIGRKGLFNGPLKTVPPRMVPGGPSTSPKVTDSESKCDQNSQSLPLR